MPAIFISHSSHDGTIADDIKSALAQMGFDRVFLDFDKDSGIGAGEDWEKRLYEELSRCHAVILVITPSWLGSKWCFAELAQARALGKVILPAICAPLSEPIVLPGIQAVELVDWQSGGFDRIAQRLRAITDDLARGFTLDPHRPPYPGIYAFEAEDAAIFFGRDDETRAIIERLDARRTQGGARMVVIIGASGAGKSSLLKAGVLPQLGRRRDQWIVLPTVRPEKAPVEAFAKILAQGQSDQAGWRAWQERLEGADAIRDIGELAKDLRVGPARSATILLPIDQLEELFTISEAGARAAFLSLLETLLDRARDLPFLAVATGRADVLQGLLEAGKLAALMEAWPLSTMPLDRVPQLVEGPAAITSLIVEGGLAEEIARDTETAEALPLVAQTLRVLYDGIGREKRLTLAAYRALGDARLGLNPVQNSVRLVADQAIGALSPSEVELAALRDAFVPHLVRLRLEDGRRVRQPARLSELPSEAGSLVHALTEARLLVTRVVEGETLIEAAHEALFATWPTLASWLDAEHQFLADIERIKSAREAWSEAAADDKPQALLQGLLLANAREWIAKFPQRFTGREMEQLHSFITESAQAADAAQARAQRLRRLVFQAVTAAAVVFLIAAVVSSWQFQKATEAKKEAEVSLWVAYSQADLRAGRVESALGWGWRAFTEKEGDDTRSAVFAALMQISPNLLGRLSVGEALPQSLAWVDNQTLAYTTSLGQLEFLDISRGAATNKRWAAKRIAQKAKDDPLQAIVGLRPISTDQFVAVLRGGTMVAVRSSNPNVVTVPSSRQTELGAGPHAVAISTDGSMIAAVPTAESPRLYRCRYGNADASPICSDDGSLSSGFASAVEISPTGDRIAVGTRNGRVDVLAVAGSASPKTLVLHFPVVSLAWLGEPDWLAVGGADGTVAIFETLNYSELFRLAASKNPVSTLRWSPTTSKLGFACDGKIVCVATFGPEHAAQGPSDIQRFQGHTNTVTQLAWSPDGNLLATADVGHEIAVWSLAPDRRVMFDLRTPDGVEITTIASSPDGRKLAGARRDGDISLWDVSAFTPEGPGKVQPAGQLRSGAREVVSLAWRSDGALSAAYKDGTIATWPPELNDPPRVVRTPWEPFQIAFTGSSALGAVSADHRLYLIENLDIDHAVRLNAPDSPMPARAVAAYPSGSLMPATYDGGGIAIWDLSVRRILFSLASVDPIAALGLSVSPDRRLLATTGGDSTVKVFDLESRSIRYRLPIGADETGGSVGFDPTGKLLAVIGADDRIYLWQIGSNYADRFLQVDAGSSGQYSSALAWLQAAQLAVLRPEGVIRVITLEPTDWHARLNSLHFPDADPPRRSP